MATEAVDRAAAARPERGDAMVLWHLKVSNYNEKARWALDYKGLPHTRRALPAGAHAKVARGLTDGSCSTFPILVIGDEVVPDSTKIIEALEQRHPDPPLYPADPQLR